MTDRTLEAPGPAGGVGPPPPQPEKIPCQVCREPIRPGARKCIHCDSYQDWRRILGSGGRIVLVLSLLSTLIAVASALLPPLLDALHPESDLEVVRWDPAERGMTVAVLNSGNRSGLLGQPAFYLMREEGRRCTGEPRRLEEDEIDLSTGRRFPLNPSESTPSRVVPPAGFVEIQFDIEDGQSFVDEYTRLAARGGECEILLVFEIPVWESSGEEREELFALDARSVARPRPPRARRPATSG